MPLPRVRPPADRAPRVLDVVRGAPPASVEPAGAAGLVAQLWAALAATRHWPGRSATAARVNAALGAWAGALQPEVADAVLAGLLSVAEPWARAPLIDLFLAEPARAGEPGATDPVPEVLLTSAAAGYRRRVGRPRTAQWALGHLVDAPDRRQRQAAYAALQWLELDDTAWSRILHLTDAATQQPRPDRWQPPPGIPGVEADLDLLTLLSTQRARADAVAAAVGRWVTRCPALPWGAVLERLLPSLSNAHALAALEARAREGPAFGSEATSGWLCHPVLGTAEPGPRLLVTLMRQVDRSRVGRPEANRAVVAWTRVAPAEAVRPVVEAVWDPTVRVPSGGDPDDPLRHTEWARGHDLSTTEGLVAHLRRDVLSEDTELRSWLDALATRTDVALPAAALRTLLTHPARGVRVCALALARRPGVGRAHATDHAEAPAPRIP